MIMLEKIKSFTVIYLIGSGYERKGKSPDGIGASEAGKSHA